MDDDHGIDVNVGPDGEHHTFQAKSWPADRAPLPPRPSVDDVLTRLTGKPVPAWTEQDEQAWQQQLAEVDTRRREIYGDAAA